MYSAPTPSEPAWPPARAEPASATTNKAANKLVFVMGGMLTRPRSRIKYAAFVISPELDLHDLDARHWRNGWRLLAPPRVIDKPRWALVVIDGDPEKVLKVVIGGEGGQGSIEPAPLPSLSEPALAVYAKQLGV